MSATTAPPPEDTSPESEQPNGRQASDHTFSERMLDGIERIGNKMPDPAILFALLCLGIIVVSQILAWFGAHATYEIVIPPDGATSALAPDGAVGAAASGTGSDYAVRTETTEVQGLLTSDGIRFLFTSFVDNFRNFSAVAIILVVMIGVGLAEAAGLIGALIRRLVAVSSKSSLTFIIVLLGMVSSVAADAGYLVLIPLGAVAFKSVGRHPLAGIAAAFAGVSAGFGVNLLITPLDGMLVGVTNETIGPANAGLQIDLVSNLYFAIASTIFVTVVVTFVTTRLVEHRLGRYDPADASPAEEQAEQNAAEEVSAEREARGLRYALWATVAVLVALVLLTVLPGAPLRHPETGEIIGDSPFMDSLIVLITIVFFVAGLAYGRGAGTLVSKDAVVKTITTSWAGMASLLFLFLLIAQFIAYFNYSNVAEVVAVQLGDVLEQLNVGAVWLLLGFMVVVMVVNLVMPAAIAKWAILAPIFIPLFIRLGVAPEAVLAAYRVSDAPTNVITPLMPYFPLIVVFVKRYQRDSGIGTVVSIMLPYVIVLTVLWTLFFVVWYLVGIPFGPGASGHL